MNIRAASALLPYVYPAGEFGGTRFDCEDQTEILFILQVGPVLDVDLTVDVRIQESTTHDGTYTDIPGAVFPQVNHANNEGGGLLQVGRILLTSGNAVGPHLKVMTVTVNPNEAPTPTSSVIAILGRSRKNPPQAMDFDV